MCFVSLDDYTWPLLSRNLTHLAQTWRNKLSFPPVTHLTAPQGKITSTTGTEKQSHRHCYNQLCGEELDEDEVVKTLPGRGEEWLGWERCSGHGHVGHCL